MAAPAAAQAQATPEPECPPTVHCVYVPAAYQQVDPNDPVNYGNYDVANRPVDMAINSVVIHETEGTLQEVLDAFRDPTFYVSAHYVIDKDGTIYQMVPTKDVAWQAGNWWFNMHSIGIEHVGHAATGSTDFTPAMYNASAQLVRWLAARFHFPLDRTHVVGHENVPGTSGAGIPRMHVDPGPFWDWQGYMVRLGAPVVPTAGPSSKLVTVAPVWPLSKLPVTGCGPSDRPVCVPTSPLPTNFVYLRTAPDDNAPMLTDPVLGQGTTDLGNTAARAYYGQQFAVAATKVVSNGLWYQVWYDGQLGWFHSPWSAPTALPTGGTYLTPKAGKASIPVYGRPLPKQSEYPADFVPPAGAIPYPAPLPYTILAGQRYSVVSGTVPTDHYFAWTYNSSLPYDHTVFKGNDQYLRIQYNGREAFVLKSDVTVTIQ